MVTALSTAYGDGARDGISVADTEQLSPEKSVGFGAEVLTVQQYAGV